MTNIEEKLGFGEIRKLLKDLCATELGASKIDEIRFMTDAKMIEKSLSQTKEMTEILNLESDFEFPIAFNCNPIMARTSIDGTFIEEPEMAKIRKTLYAINFIQSYFKNKDEKYPLLRAKLDNLFDFTPILSKIDRIIGEDSKVKDNASRELAEIRQKMNIAERRIARAVQSVYQKAVSENYTSSSDAPVLRNGRVVIPVNAAYKYKLGGIIHDYSSTGKTVYVEPAEVVRMNNELSDLEQDQAKEIRKIMLELTAEIRPFYDEIRVAIELLSEFDLIFAKARLAIKMQATKPIILEDCTGFSWQKARHPLLFLQFQRENRELVPLDIKMDYETSRTLIISGPNAGGKSVVLKSVGLLQYMLQMGLLLPMKEGSEAILFDKIMIEIGDNQSAEDDLSTYSAHLKNMKSFVEHARARTLLLIDEFGGGTEPNLGGALAESILLHLHQKQAFTLVTTHYGNLKKLATENPAIENAAMTYNSDEMKPLFKLEIGHPGSSFAFEIAQNIGLPRTILDNARAKVGEMLEMEQQLNEARKFNLISEEKLKKIQARESDLEQKLSEQAEALNAALVERKTIIAQAKEEAKKILQNANRLIEKTIKTIKEAQAEKEATRLARLELEQLSNSILSENNDKTTAELSKKIKKIKPKHSKNDQSKTIKEEETPILVGDLVASKDGLTKGEIIEIKNQTASIAIGNMTMKQPLSELVKISNKELKRLNTAAPKVENYSTYNKRLNFKSQIDLRGFRTDEALVKVEEFIDEAIMLSQKEVKILHGKGNGILRKMIRDFLQYNPAISKLEDEHIEHGGAGITIVRLR